LPAGHRHIGEALIELGSALTGLGRFAEAEELLLEAVQSLGEGQGSEDRRTRRARRKLAYLYESWGKPDQATRYDDGTD
jgi:hypothetical protein